MRRHTWRLCAGLLLATCSYAQAPASRTTITWQQAEERFRTNNPSLLAGKNTIDEARADEITAALRPNPDLTFTADDLGFFQFHPFQPTGNAILAGSFSYLHEREHKRELRTESARKATDVAISAQDDLQRTLLFNLRDAFVRVLLAKAVRQVAQDNLNYYQNQIDINRTRFEAGDLSRVDFQRVELQRMQYESELQSSEVSLRTAKIDLLELLRERTPVDQFDVSEGFDYAEPVTTISELRDTALRNRPDLREAVQSIEKAQTDHRLAIANGSADPTIGVDVGRQPPLVFYAGVSVSIPLRIFDRNQGEKARTAVEVQRSERLRDAAEMAALHDVDSAYTTLESTLKLLRPYREKYLKEAEDVRSTVSFSYGHGAASLLEFLDAQRQFRDTQLTYLNLIGSYLSAANQVNFAVGQEVIR